MRGIEADISLNGTPYTLGGADITAYTVADSAARAAAPVGTAASKRFSLTFLNSRSFDLSALKGAQVNVYLTENGTRVPFGVWYVRRVSTDTREGGLCTLSGADALSSKLEIGFSDSAAQYPQTLRALIVRLISPVSGMTLAGGTFPNSALVIPALPLWEKGITFRRALMHAAFMAGSCARVNYAGQLELVQPGTGTEYAPDADMVERLTLTGGGFKFNCVRYLFDGDENYTRFAKNSGLTDTEENTLRGSLNPLATRAGINALVSGLANTAFESGEITLSDGCILQAGDSISFDGHTLLITGAELRFDAFGLRTVYTANLPCAGASGCGAGVSAFNPDGSINTQAIGGFQDRVLGVQKAYIEALTAGDITANGLLAKLIEAAKIKAREISAGDVSTDSLTALSAEIISATLRKLSAGTVTSDALFAAACELTAAKIESLNADNISADRLASALAAFTVLTAGTATFDKATVKHLIAEALNVQDAVGDKVFISNLVTDYASMVSANVGNLCIKAADGNYYRLDVNSQGQVTATIQSVSEAEADAGVTENGKTIIESQIAASDLNATNIKAVYALINRIDAARLDVGTLTARNAFINTLRTTDITSNTYIRLALDSLRDGIDDIDAWTTGLKRWLTFDENGLTQGKEGSIYSTVTDQTGFHIRREGTAGYVGSFAREGLRTDGITLGDIIATRTSTGGWVWKEVEQ